MLYKYSMQIPSLSCVKHILRKYYSGLLYPQTCVLCGNKSGDGLPLCKRCIDTEFRPYLESAGFSDSTTGCNTRCRHCGKILISEKHYCTRCRPSNNEHTEMPPQSCTRIFTLFPYIGLGQRLLPVWKNNNIRTFSAVFAPLVRRFLMQNPELTQLPIVPVPPRPKKLREKGWDQVEDLAHDLAAYPPLSVCRCLKRKDGTPQKKLSKKERAVNLQGKISTAAKPIPQKLILLDDVMTTGATLEACARILKQAGSTTVYALCLFFD